MKKLWIVSEVYYPDEVGNPYYLTGIAEAMARRYSVGVICGQPKYNARGAAVPRREVHNGVRIERCLDSSLNKDNLVLRVFNVFVSSFSLWFKALARVGRGDVVLVVTAPPLLPFGIAALGRLRGAKIVLKIDDVYPEIFVATGLIGKGTAAEAALVFLNKVLYRSVDAIFVLGRDMARLAEAKAGPRAAAIRIVPNWADVDEVGPRPKAGNPLLAELGIADRFVVQCAGNMGRAQAVETMMAAAERLREREDIVFLFIGAGKKVPWMRAEIEEKGLRNVVLLGQRPRGEQGVFLNACDLSLISLLPGMTGAGVPSRLYNVMAAGKPVVAVTREDSEIALAVREEGIGWVAPPDEPERLAGAILEAKAEADREGGRLEEMGRRARRAAEAKYAKAAVLALYERELGALVG